MSTYAFSFATLAADVAGVHTLGVHDTTPLAEFTLNVSTDLHVKITANDFNDAINLLVTYDDTTDGWVPNEGDDGVTDIDLSVVVEEVECGCLAVNGHITSINSLRKTRASLVGLGAEDAYDDESDFGTITNANIKACFTDPGGVTVGALNFSKSELMMSVDSTLLTQQLRTFIFNVADSERTTLAPFKGGDVIGCPNGYTTGISEVDIHTQLVNGGPQIVPEIVPQSSSASTVGQIQITLI